MPEQRAVVPGFTVQIKQVGSASLISATGTARGLILNYLEGNGYLQETDRKKVRALRSTGVIMFAAISGLTREVVENAMKYAKEKAPSHDQFRVISVSNGAELKGDPEDEENGDRRELDNEVMGAAYRRKLGDVQDSFTSRIEKREQEHDAEVAALKSAHANEEQRLKEQVYAERRRSGDMEKAITGLTSRVKEVKKELETTRAELAATKAIAEKRAESRSNMPPYLVDTAGWDGASRISSQIEALLSTRMDDAAILDIVHVGRMESDAYVREALSHNNIQVPAEGVSTIPKSQPWEETEEFKRLAPSVTSAKEVLEWLRGEELSGKKVPQIVINTLKIDEQRRLVDEFEQKKKEHEVSTRASTIATEAAQEHARAKRFLEVTEPWRDEPPAPVMIIFMNSAVMVQVPHAPTGPWNQLIEGMVRGSFEHTFSEGTVMNSNGGDIATYTFDSGMKSLDDDVVKDFIATIRERFHKSSLSQLGLKFAVCVVQRF